MKLRAIKTLTYGTRRLQPGDEFEARDRDVRLLIGIRKAQRIREEGAVPAPPSSLVEKVAATVSPQPTHPPKDPLDHDGNGRKGGSTAPPASEDLKTARAEYEKVFDKQPFMGWPLDVLQAKIAAEKAKQAEQSTS